jgi:hypothetical protein
MIASDNSDNIISSIMKNTINKESSIEEQEKELLYWESQYENMFKYIEKKKQDRLNKQIIYRTMFSKIKISQNKRSQK